MFSANVIVFQFRSFDLRGIEDFFHARTEEEVRRANALNFVTAAKLTFEIGFKFRRWDTDFFEQTGVQAVGLADHCQQQMLAINFLMRKTLRYALRLLQRLL